ncbi:MAG TPA: dihydroorotate dehydrogenase electron transfer subunit [Firmicutes bacterium]|nr:dihydroorotate dehydrogenase electron transfer subunit [Bacillota bacterium]
MRPILARAEVVWNIPLGTHTAAICFYCPEVASSAKPGQFVHLQLAPFLPRPFSIAAAGNGRICLIYQVIGPGTHDLRGRREGHTVDLLGPLGKPFDPPAQLNLVSVSGGVGLAGVSWLALKQALSGRQALIVHGQRSKHFMDVITAFECIRAATEMKGPMPAMLFATDDGSEGLKGTAVDLLASQWRAGPPGGIAVIGCGPRPMLSALKHFCLERQVPCFLSMEERMGCGIGACLGCAVPSASGGYFHVCKDGPVFPAEEVLI